jgi:uncharacterized protein (TIGR02996 family)
MHTVMEGGREGWTVIDLGALSGTVVNGKQKNKATLEDGDEVVMGGLSLTIRLLEEPPWFFSDEAKPLRAEVLQTPRDEAPRAVFADWLLERADPMGELIRCQLAGQAPPEPFMESFVVGHLPLLVRDWKVRRGFLEAIRVKADNFGKLLPEELMRVHPLDQVMLDDDTDNVAARATALGLKVLPF